MVGRELKEWEVEVLLGFEARDLNKKHYFFICLSNRLNKIYKMKVANNNKVFYLSDFLEGKKNQIFRLKY